MENQLTVERMASHYMLINFELGAFSTGKRSANYEAWFSIHDDAGDEIKGHPLAARCWGKWPKVQAFINKCERAAKKNKLQCIVSA